MDQNCNFLVQTSNGIIGTNETNEMSASGKKHKFVAIFFNTSSCARENENDQKNRVQYINYANTKKH